MTQALCPLSEAPVLLDSLIAALKGLTGTPAIVAFEMSGQRVGAMDVLSDVLRVVRLSGAVFFTADFSSPWAIESPVPARLASAVMPDAECIVLFHILVDGECAVACQGHPVMTMEAGDVVVFPHGEQHTMGSHGAATATPLSSVFSPGKYDEPPQLSFGGGGRASRLVCGYLNFDQRFGPLVEALPTMLIVRSRNDYSAIEAIDGRGATWRRGAATDSTTR